MSSRKNSRPPIQIGQRFNRLVVIAPAKRPVGRHTRGRWWCLCDCGNKHAASEHNLPRTKSCGCWQREWMRFVSHQSIGVSRPGALKHGANRKGKMTPEYQSWRAMKMRCLNPNFHGFKYYGGTTPPIKICDRWLDEHGFENFLIDLGPRPTGTTLGRFGDAGNYEPGNCKWMTSAEQTRERRRRYVARPPIGKSNIFWDGIQKRFRVRFTVDKKKRYFGSFVSRKAAECARNKAFRQLFGKAA